jgi:hypothetical protein
MTFRHEWSLTLMRLYHYLESKWALDDIRRRRIKLSKIDDMNDPFELKCVFSRHNLTQTAIEQTGAELAESFSALCFSRDWDSILMWSHYGDRHKGICLGFDVREEIARPVDYVPEPILVGNLVVERGGDVSVEQLRKTVESLLGTKYDGWFYEKEIRVHTERAEIDEETGQYFADFSERVELKEVIAGARFPLSKKPIVDALEAYSDVEIYKARVSTERFEIVKGPW